ncbi:hypothetical protein BV22DRAFT_1199359 [Leucogyrophana mollusca]|uniref:Uncharacterized protein n=1 Tax=Leucogyrophana mollusca TaxID=85980 RepID=A0ACB8B2A9_9AGAM|nr:hypothetical protein BV22DRAFT_1199359 [Leucogyrophana mollusca]
MAGQAPHGTRRSPIIADVITQSSITISDAVVRACLPALLRTRPATRCSLKLWSAYRDGRSVLYVVDLIGGTPPQEIDCLIVEVAAIRQITHDTASGMRSVEGSGVKFCSFTSTPSGLVPSYEAARKDSAASSLSTLISPPRPMALAWRDQPLYVVYHAPFNSGSSVTLDWTKQYFTSCGLDVNYGGSSLYGRAYMAWLNSKWGELDGQDCIDVVHLLFSPPYSLIDQARMVIRGGSAGGLTVLAAASTAKDVSVRCGDVLIRHIRPHRAGEESHKFELKIIEGLVGGSDKEIHSVYVARSPLFHVESVAMPLLAEEIVAKIKVQGGKVQYRLFQGEGQWQRADTKKAALEAELGWYEEVLGLKSR